MPRMISSKFFVFALLAQVLFAAACAPPTPGTAPAMPVLPTQPVNPSPPVVHRVTLVPPLAASATETTGATAANPSISLTPTTTVEGKEGTHSCTPWFDPLAFLADGKRLVGITQQESKPGAQLFNFETGKVEAFFPAPYAVMKAAISPDGTLLAWALDDHVIRLVSLADGAEAGILEGHFNRITGLEFSSDGERLVSASADGWVRVWSRSGELLSAFQPGEVLGMGLAPNGRELITIHFDGPARAWNLDSGKQIGEYAGSVGGGYDASYADFSPDGAYVAISYGAGGAASLWQAAEQAEIWSGGLMAIAISPDNRTFAVGEMDETGDAKLVFRSLADQAIVREFDRHDAMVWRVIFSPNGELVASSSGVETFVWRVTDGEIVHAWDPTCP